MEIIIRSQTLEEEFEYLKRIINKLPWYKENGYTVGLPENPHLKQPMKPENMEERFKLFREEEYSTDFFIEGLKALEENRWRIEKSTQAFERLNKMWGFKIFPEYQITLTKYGPGGTYNSNTGIVLMLTTKQGSFRRSHPSHTAVHEMVHIGIEEIIVKHFNLTHLEKERVVDLIVYKLFGSFLPNYKLQDRGDKKVDPFITLETIEELPIAIERFIAEYPR